MNDLIERSAVIDLIDKYTQDMSTDYWTTNYGIPSGVFEDEIMELPSAQPEPSIPLLWIEKHIEWLKSLDNEFANLAATHISVMVNKWRGEQE